jgi:GGDEF domain-containing protein
MALLKSYLNRGNDTTLLRQAFSLMLQKLASEAVVSDEDACAALAADIDRLRQYAEQEATPDAILRAAESVMQVMSAYNSEITVLLRKQQRGLQNIVRTMAETVASIAGDSTASAAKLREISGGLDSGPAITDIDALRLNVGGCMRDFCEEALRQREQTESLIISLRREIELGPQEAENPEPPDLDPLTGLPSKETCVKALHRSIPARKRRYVVTLVVNNLEAINARFGQEIGNRVLCRFIDFAVQMIRADDRLFRWSGPTLVMVVETAETLDKVRTFIGRILEPRLEETLHIEGRSVLILISASWSAFQLTTTVAQAERQIETFTASRRSGDGWTLWDEQEKQGPARPEDAFR